MNEYIPHYTELSLVYDRILEHVDYSAWYKYILSIMERYAGETNFILELGCGTGRFGVKFSADGYTIFGMDRSFDMLKAARMRAVKNFRIFCGDIRHFHLRAKPDFIFCVHDTMNYLLTKKDFRSALRCVKNVMKENSVFLFDITTPYNIETYFENNTTVYSINGRSVEWSNSFNRKKALVHSAFRFHNGDGTYREENHIQRLYTVPEIKAMLKKEGFVLADVFGDYGFEAPDSKTVMINFITKPA